MRHSAFMTNRAGGLVGLASIVAAALLALPAPALATGDANEAGCPATTESSPGFRAFLPDCRAFELVTPPYKEGGGLLGSPGAISRDGSHVIIGSAGAYAGAGNYWLDVNKNGGAVTYEFTRETGGWQPTALTPPAQKSPKDGFPNSEYPHSALLAVDPGNFETTLWSAAPVDIQYNENIYIRTGSGESGFHEIGPGIAPEVMGEELNESSRVLGFAGASHDLTRSLFQVHAFSENEMTTHNGHSNLWPGDTTEQEASSLYEYVYNEDTGISDAEPELVGVRNKGTPPWKAGSHHLNGGAELVSDCGTELGSGGDGSAYNAVSASGETVFFTALQCAGGPSVNELYARVNRSELVNISEPALPAGECSAGEPCSGATPEPAIFQGASENGTQVFFLSEQPLVNGVPTAGDKLYEATMEESKEGWKVSRLVDISADPTSGQPPEVQGVVRVSEDGERVYFVASAKLTREPRGGDCLAELSPSELAEEEATEDGRCRPKAEADNIYAYEPDPAHPGSHHAVFVATLLTPTEKAALGTAEALEEAEVETEGFVTYEFEENEISLKYKRGEISETRKQELSAEAFERFFSFFSKTLGTRGSYGTLGEDQSVWGTKDERAEETTPDGGSLVFLSSADLTKGDESRVPQLFEYQAGNESLTRVSIGQAGPTSGNVDTFNLSPGIPGQSFANGIDRPEALEAGLAISEDGTRVFFTSTASLVPQAAVNAKNVYEYREGHVYLVSGGDDASLFEGGDTVALTGIDPSGQNAFFDTASQLVPEDGETQMVLYDSHEDGGFPAPTLGPGCIGETCRGSAAATPQSPSPGSAGQAGGGNVASSVTPPPAVRSKPKEKTKGCRKGFVRRKGKCVRRPRAKKANAKRAGNRRGAGR
jgi:hypothetical protein